MVFVAILGLAITADFPEEEGVLVLGEDNFDQAIKQYEFILVEFYAPWCGHCKSLAPEYAKAAQALAQEEQPLRLAKVDATVHKDLGSRFGVQGFPTLKLFSNGSPSEYNGGRTEPEIVSWMKKKAGPSTQTFTTVEQVNTFKSANDVAVVYFGDNAEDVEVFTRIARSSEDLLFATCATAECATEFQVQPRTVVVFKKFDEGRNDTQEITEDALKTFITAKSAPLVMKFDEKSAQIIFGKATPGIFLYRDPNTENSAELDKIMSAVATQTQGKIQVLTTGISVGLETRLSEYIGVTAADLPSVRIHDTRNDLKKFNMEGEITEANVLQFIKDWEAGNLKPTLKSDDIPAEQNEDVYVLVGKAFDQVVMDPTKDVLVEFYAPWCGHCKKLTPIYEEVARNLKHNKNLIIAKMDATANETDKVSIQGFPTIKFWPANQKDAPMDFSGDRTVEGFTKFLTEKSSNTVTANKEDL